jgi:hypothetical protein
MKGNATDLPQGGDSASLTPADACVRPRHKMTVELPSNIKLRLDVETTDAAIYVSERAGEQRAPGNCASTAGIHPLRKEVEVLNEIIELADTSVCFHPSFSVLQSPYIRPSNRFSQIPP